MTSTQTPRTCTRGHQYYKSSDCPVCPVCANEDKPAHGFLLTLSNPARRALEHISITTVKQLAEYTQKEIMALHGIGPASLPKLKTALNEAGLKFKT